ncbi:inosine/xanthosine triphosphatase [Colwelliaceae bacterium 6471]
MEQNQISIVVGSKNPVKINAVKNSFVSYFPNSDISCRGEHAPSGVADQPMTTTETREGAINRVNYCQENFSADYYVAIEGGVDSFSYGPATFAYVVIANDKQESIGRSANLPLPVSVYNALKSGEELGDVMDKLFNTKNIKQQGGAMGLLTNHVATRESTYTQALILAFAPFIHSSLFSQ